MRTVYGFFEESQLHQPIVRKFNHAVMIGRCCVFEESAVSVFADLFRFQDLWGYLQANDLAFPIKLVLLDVVKAICLVINWRRERRRRNLFVGWRIIE